ncbi:hypothetical protein NV379_16100 [Paenibacillus sp. N1-5-1-14]|uniref:precorrin-2 dehydrogenase/sirohydrochlorin ferrochelatase family protein n=1 Tax=Paenibacillus radicibacter TaxID=2972488 RepID=UPI002158FA81|nr:NAD(P)-dependent oxidoreductase [Paenibacillus radicibacter]MCR8644177.1 hypothetical protein [Paenibacillus radicibacter]
MGYPYPIMINLVNQTCLVVGGGQVAERKVSGLLEAGAIVHLLSPHVTDRLKDLIDDSLVVWLEGNYTSDTKDIFQKYPYRLVFTATSEQAINEQVARDAAESHALVCRVDHAQFGDFTVPAVLRRGDLNITISTGGASPALAAGIKRELEERYGEEYEIYLEFLQELRVKLKDWVQLREERKELFRGILKLELLPLIRQGKSVWLPIKELIWLELELQPNLATLNRLNNRVQLWEERFDA